MQRFELRDVVYHPKYGYGEVIYISTLGFDVQFINGVLGFDNTGHGCIHASERWKKEAYFAIACIVSFFAGILFAGGNPCN